jgi:hypothetical protein
MVDGLNKLLGVILSKEELTLRDMRVEVSRQRTLDEKEIVPARVVVNLEFGEPTKDHFASLGELVAEIKEEGFKVSSQMERVEIEVSLPHAPPK